MYKKKWLLKTAGLSACLFLILYLFIDQDHLADNFYNFSQLPIWSFILGVVFLAPIIEEVFFRGFFSNKKYLKIISLIGLPLLLIIEAFNTVTVGLFIIFIILILLHFKKATDQIFNLVIILNALLFSLSHFPLNNFYNIFTNYYILLYFSVGLFLIWIILNYGILKSILFHLIWNFIVVASLMFSLQFPNSDLQHFENEFIKVKWNAVPRFNQNTTQLGFESSSVMAKQIEARRLYLIVNANLNIKSEGEVLQFVPYKKYDFSITIKDTTMNQRQMMKHTKDFLLNSNLVYENKL